MEQIGLTPVDAVTVTVVMDNVFDALMAGGGPVRRMAIGAAPRVASSIFEEGETLGGLSAEHGFSALVDVTVAGRSHRLLFDAGVSPDGVVTNLTRMGVDPATIEVVVLSHGHFDHTGGMEGLTKALGPAGLPVFVHPAMFTRRRLEMPGRDAVMLPTPSRSALEGAGFALTEDRRPSFLLDGAVLLTGEIDRSNDFEPGMPPPHQAFLDGAWRHDPLVLDDQALVVNVRGEGLLVLSGCGHAGIVNTVHHARRLTGVDDVVGVAGGFHLGGPFYEPVVGQVVEGLSSLRPRVLLPGHCTGWKATAALAAAMPEATQPSCVGTRVSL